MLLALELLVLLLLRHGGQVLLCAAVNAVPRTGSITCLCTLIARRLHTAERVHALPGEQTGYPDTVRAAYLVDPVDSSTWDPVSPDNPSGA